GRRRPEPESNGRSLAQTAEPALQRCIGNPGSDTARQDSRGICPLRLEAVFGAPQPRQDSLRATLEVTSRHEIPPGPASHRDFVADTSLRLINQLLARIVAA